MDNQDSENNPRPPREEMRISGDDIIAFLRRIFRAGYSRSAVVENEEGKKLFKINLILLILISFLVPVIALVFVIVLIVADYSISIHKKEIR